MRTATPTAPAHAEEMAVVHRVFRRGFPMVARLVRCTAPGATGRSQVVAEHLAFLLDGLHHHHTGEDEKIWPLLLERSAPQAALVKRMESQHETVTERSARVRSRLAEWRPSATNGESLAAALDDLNEALVEHLDAEEAHVVPLIRRHISAEEWERFGQEAFAKFSNAEKLKATGTLEDVATPEEASWFTSGLPVPIKVMWRLAGRRKYARYIARVRGTGREGPMRQWVLRRFNRVAVALYRRSGGRIGGSAKGLPVLLITVPGRRTGTLRTVPVVYIEFDGAYIVTGSSGGAKAEPQWFRNLRASHWARVQTGDGEPYVAEARVADTAEREHLWHDVVLARAPFFAKYQEKAERVIPVAVLTTPTPG